MATPSPKNVTIKGRLSFPNFTMPQALAQDLKSSWPAANKADVSPSYNLLLEPSQLEKLKKHILEVFLPYAEEQNRKGEKRDALTPKQVKQFVEKLEDEAWTEQTPFLMIKAISEKNQPNAPECVASVVVRGNKGQDISVQATVYSEDQLAVPDPDILAYPVRKPIGETVFTPYPGAYFVTTLNLFAFQGVSAGISAGGSVALYMGNLEGERFGGGTAVDEDEIFMD